MNRELKVRAWDKVFQKIVKLKGFYINGGYTATIYMDPLGFRTISLSESKIMQYSGINDSNGVEIYEDDIHGFETEIDGEMTWCYLPVVFTNGAFWLDESFKNDGSMLTLLCEYKDEPLNIVGNRHENPKLL